MVYQVADLKPAQMALFDYYDPEQQVLQTSVDKALLEWYAKAYFSIHCIVSIFQFYFIFPYFSIFSISFSFKLSQKPIPIQ